VGLVVVAGLPLLRCDVQLKEIAILFALILLLAIAVRWSAGELIPKDLRHLISR